MTHPAIRIMIAVITVVIFSKNAFSAYAIADISGAKIAEARVLLVFNSATKQDAKKELRAYCASVFKTHKFHTKTPSKFCKIVKIESHLANGYLIITSNKEETQAYSAWHPSKDIAISTAKLHCRLSSISCSEDYQVYEDFPYPTIYFKKEISYEICNKTNAARCTCINSLCLRIYSDGCTEYYKADTSFNSIRKVWEYDTKQCEKQKPSEPIQNQ